MLALTARLPVGLYRPTLFNRAPMILVAGIKEQAATEDDDKHAMLRFERKIHNKQKRTEEDKLTASDFLLKYARFNLGPAMMGKLVSREIQDAIYQLHIKDTDYWTVPRLAVKFGLKYNRTAAVLMSKFTEKKAEKKLKKGETLDFELERLMGEEFGWIVTDNFVPTPGAGSLQKVHSDLTNLGDEVDFALIAKAYEKKEIVPPPHQFPTVAPKFHIPARKISGPTRVNKLHKHRLIFMDVDNSRNRNKKTKKIPHEEKFMMIRDFDGSFRTPAWEERMRISRRLSNAPQKDRGKVDLYPHDIKKALHPRIPFMKRDILQVGRPKHTPRGPNAIGESFKHVPKRHLVK